jgi:hypothetical protein
MIYNSKEEALLTRERFINTKDDTSDMFLNHCKKYYFYTASKLDGGTLLDHRKFGRYFLYEKEVDDKLHYPQLAIYINELPCDQTTEVEYINCRRTWEWRTEYKYLYEYRDGVGKEYTNYIAESESNIERTILWGDSMYVYGAWDSMPNWKELKQAYERTWWFHRTYDEIRDIQLNRILNGL